MTKILKITAIVLFILILVFFGLQSWLGYKIKSVIEKEGAEFGGGFYTATVEDASVNLFGRSVTLGGITLVPDSTRLDGAPRPDMILALAAEGVSGSGLSMKMLRKGSDFKLGSVEIRRPVVTVDLFEPEEKEETADTARNRQTFPASRVAIRDGSIVVRRHKLDGDVTFNRADGIDLEISEKSAGNLTGGSLRERFAAGLSIRRLLVTNGDESVDTTVDSIRLDARDGRLTVAAVNVVPRYSMGEFVYKSRKHTDWTTLWARGIEIHGLDVARRDSSTLVTADSVSVSSAHVDSYKDRNAQQPYRYKKLFFESVQQLPVLVSVGRIAISGMDAIYREVPRGGSTAGVINFTGLSGVFTGLTNVPSEEKYYTLAAHGSMYGAAPLSATFHFPVSPSTNRFEVSGTLGRMDMTRLNKTIKPLANAEIEQGVIDRLRFHIVGSTGQASVDLELLYHDLKVELEKRTVDNRFKERRFLSWVANTFVIKDSNPLRGETRRGTGTAQRDPNRSQFNYLWRTLIEGVKETAGL